MTDNFTFDGQSFDSGNDQTMFFMKYLMRPISLFIVIISGCGEGRGRSIVMVLLVVVLLNDRNISCFKIKEVALFLNLVCQLGITSM